MLEIDSVSLTFSGRQVLSGCYLNCAKGEVVGLLGRNGSGKSSLMKVIFGSLAADFKHLRIDGKIVKCGYRSGKVAYLSQDSFLPPFLTVNDLLRHLDIYGHETMMAIELIRKNAATRVGNLSGGELRILECAWILLQPASYILLDEPFMGISPVYIELLQDLIRKIAHEKAIVLTDHIYRPLLEISDRIVLLHNNAVYQIREESDLIRYQYIPDFS